MGFTINPNQVVVAPGSKPLLFALFDVLGGDVLLPRPSWVSYEPQVKHAGKRLFWVETDEHDRHTITSKSYMMLLRLCDKHRAGKLTASSLRASLDRTVAEGARPRIMLINSPSNPTGQTFSHAALHEITNFCRDNNMTLISDEIYADLTFDKKDQSTPCSKENFDAGRVIMTGGLSKVISRPWCTWHLRRTNAHNFPDLLRRRMAHRLCHISRDGLRCISQEDHASVCI